MISNQLRLHKFQQKLIKRENLSFKKALRIYEALHQEAVSLGIINDKNILYGLEADLRIARILNSYK